MLLLGLQRSNWCFDVLWSRRLNAALIVRLDIGRGFAFRGRHHWVLLEPSLANAVLYKAKYNNQGLPSVGFGSFYLSWFCCTLHRKKYCSSLKMMTSRRMRMQCLSGLVGKEGCTGCLRCSCKLTWSGTECNINAEPASTILVSSTEITAGTNAR